MSPSRSAASSIATPMRSLTLPPGLTRLELAEQLDLDVVGEHARQLDHRRAADVLGDVDRDSGSCTARACCQRHPRAVLPTRRCIGRAERYASTWWSVDPTLLERDEGARDARRCPRRPPARARDGVVLVEGETGVGKSSAAARCRDPGQRARAHRPDRPAASELERDFPFGLVVQLLERLVVGLPPDERDALLSGPARMATPLFPVLRTMPGDDAEDPFALVHGAYWLMARLAERSPLLVVVDDVQWIDERSLLVLRHLAARVAELPVVLLAAGARDAPGGAGPLDVLAGADMPVRLRPQPLSAEAVARVVRAEFPDADEAFAQGCAEATSGVPLLLHELLAAVRGQDAAADRRDHDAPGPARPARGRPRGADAARGDARRAPPPSPAPPRCSATTPSCATPPTSRASGSRRRRSRSTRCARRASPSPTRPCASATPSSGRRSRARCRPPAGRTCTCAPRSCSSARPPRPSASPGTCCRPSAAGAAGSWRRCAGPRGARWPTARRARPPGTSSAPWRSRRIPPTRAQIVLELARAEAADGSPRAPARIREALAPVDDADTQAWTLAELAHVPAARGDRRAVVDAFVDGLLVARRRNADPEATRWLEATLLAEAREEPAPAPQGARAARRGRSRRRRHAGRAGGARPARARGGARRPPGAGRPRPRRARARPRRAARRGPPRRPAHRRRGPGAHARRRRAERRARARRGHRPRAGERVA